jgi:hypothetical protein
MPRTVRVLKSAPTGISIAVGALLKRDGLLHEQGIADAVRSYWLFLRLRTSG